MKRHICRWCGDKIVCGNKKNIVKLIEKHENKCYNYQEILKEQTGGKQL